MELLMVLLIFPLLSFVFGIIGQLVIKKIPIVVGITFIFWLVATYTVFNDSFLIWAFVYSLLTLIGAGVVYFVNNQ